VLLMAGGGRGGELLNPTSCHRYRGSIRKSRYLDSANREVSHRLKEETRWDDHIQKE
jgi:hypothetical protein